MGPSWVLALYAWESLPSVIRAADRETIVTEMDVHTIRQVIRLIAVTGLDEFDRVVDGAGPHVDQAA